MKLHVEIPLANSPLKFKVSKSDEALFLRYRWRLNTWGYICTTATCERPTIYAHILPLGKKKLHKVDHKNGDKFDCRRENLRHATHSQNNINKPGRKKYKGVTYVPKINKLNPWMAQIQYEKVHYCLGYFASEKAAAHAYNVKALELAGEFALLNKVEKPLILRRSRNNQFRGVSRHTKNGNWVASICVKGKSVHLGCYARPLDAAVVYAKVRARLRMP